MLEAIETANIPISSIFLYFVLCFHFFFSYSQRTTLLDLYECNSKTFLQIHYNIGLKRTFCQHRLWYANFVSIFYNISDLRHLRTEWIIYIEMIKYPQLNFHFFSYLHNATCISIKIWLDVCENIYLFFKIYVLKPM